MAADIQDIIMGITAICPDVLVRQLQVKHPGADDDGLWFFERDNLKVQLESSSGNCPFLIEQSSTPQRLHADSIEQAIAILKIIFAK